MGKNRKHNKNDILTKIHSTVLNEKHRTSPPNMLLGKGVLEICSKVTGERP